MRCSGFLQKLIDLLQDNRSAFDVLIKTDIPNLTLLPAGSLDRHSTELLASDAMKRLANELSVTIRIVPSFSTHRLCRSSQGAVLSRW